MAGMLQASAAWHASASRTRGRAGACQVNAAVDDAAALAEACARLLAATRAQGKLPAADRKRAQMLLVNVHVRPSARRGLAVAPVAGAWTGCRWLAHSDGALPVLCVSPSILRLARTQQAHACQTCRHQQRAWRIGANLLCNLPAQGTAEPPQDQLCRGRARGCPLALSWSVNVLHARAQRRRRGGACRMSHVGAAVHQAPVAAAASPADPSGLFGRRARRASRGATGSPSPTSKRANACARTRPAAR